MNLTHMILGACILFFGRRLFWLFVGVAGFFAGLRFGGQVFSEHPQWLILLLSVLLGAGGVLVALFLERVAFGIGGFYAGAYGAMVWGAATGIAQESFTIMFIGGVIGAVVALVLMDWALIILSSLVGAGAVVLNVPLRKPTAVIFYMVLAAIGIAFQSVYFLKLKEKGAHMDGH